jgi:signal peptidase II
MAPMTFLVAALLVALDQAAKAWTVAALPLGGPGEPVIPGALYLTYIRNEGAAFGMLRRLDVPLGPVTLDGTFLLGVLSAAVSLWLIVHLARHGRDHGPWMRAALVMVLAGAVGNMIDRFRLGYVIDFLHVNIGWFDFPVFNVADALVSVGAVLLLAVTLLGPGRGAASEAGSRTPGEGRATTPGEGPPATPAGADEGGTT